VALYKLYHVMVVHRMCRCHYLYKYVRCEASHEVEPRGGRCCRHHSHLMRACIRTWRQVEALVPRLLINKEVVGMRDTPLGHGLRLDAPDNYRWVGGLGSKYLLTAYRSVKVYVIKHAVVTCP
jgi:hypothetical protein